MYVGILNTNSELTFTRPDSKIPFLPDENSSNERKWNWNSLLDSELDINAELEYESYVGAVSIKLPTDSVKSVCVLVDGVKCATKNTDSDGCLGGEITLSVGTRGKRITVRLECNFQDVSFLDTDLEILGYREDGNPYIYPTPKSVKFLDGYEKIGNVIAKNSTNDEKFAADYLKEELAYLNQGTSKNGILTVLEVDASFERERYTIEYSQEALTLRSGSRIGLLYAIDTLIKTVGENGFRRAAVDDSPTKPLRGFHLGLPHRDRMNFAKKLFKYVLLPMRYNVIFLEFAGGMRFDKHPEISEGWLRAAENAKKGLQPFMPHADKVSNYSLLEKEEVKDLVAYVKELGFELIPEVQSLAHVQYITYAHPEIAEIEEKKIEVDTRTEGDMRPDIFYAHSYCPSNEKSYEIIHDIIDEILEVTNPSTYVHMGHDEVYQIGLCKRCRTKSPAELYARHVNDVHAYLKARGLKMMLWSDMLHPAPVTNYLTYDAANMIPKDIVMLDFIWYFNLDRNIEDNLLNKGFKVAAGNLYSSHYPRYKERIFKDGMIGGEVSTWVIADEEIFAESGKLWDAMYLSQMLWRPELYDERNRRAYTDLIAKNIQPQTREKVRDNRNTVARTPVSLTVIGENHTVPSVLKCALPNVVIAEGIISSPSEKYEKLFFEHATVNAAPKFMYKKHQPIGEYVITFEDGSEQRELMRYGNQAMRYDIPYATPKPHQFYRHFGYIGTWFSDPTTQIKAAGKDIIFLTTPIDVKYPEKKITKIEFIKDESDYTTLMLASLKGCKS